MSRRRCGLEEDLIDTAEALGANAKGLLAIDKSNHNLQ
jgi:hypothetical protein